MREVNANSNLTGVLKDMLTGDVIQANELVCGGRIKASLLVNQPDGKQHIVEIVEDELAHYETSQGEMEMRQRGRLAD